MADLVMAIAFVVIAGLIAVDRVLAAPRPAGAHAAASRAARTPAAPGLPTVMPRRAAPQAAPGLRGLHALNDDAEGWALLGPGGGVLATNMPRLQALLAGACAVLTLGQGDVGAGPVPAWRTRASGGQGATLLGQASPRGAVLAVVAASGSDRERLERTMTWALAEWEAEWGADWVRRTGAPAPMALDGGPGGKS